MRKTTITAWLALDQVEQLESLARRTGVNRSQLIGRAVKELLDHPDKYVAYGAENGSPPVRRRATAGG